MVHNGKGTLSVVVLAALVALLIGHNSAQPYEEYVDSPAVQLKVLERLASDLRDELISTRLRQKKKFDGGLGSRLAISSSLVTKGRALKSAQDLNGPGK